MDITSSTIFVKGMGIPAVVFVLPLGILFIISGIIVNLIQAFFFILVRPLSKNLYRKINKVVVELLWLELIWLVDWWSATKVEVYTDKETFELMGKEHALMICNHRSDIDWLVGWVLAQRAGCLGSALAIMKKEVKFLPIIGWSMWFSDYVFLERSWIKDQNTLKSAFQRLEGFPMPFWLALFVEGTRFTQEKLLASQDYASSSGLPIPRNVLIPRTKGFVSSVTHMRSFVPAIYDCTVAVPKDQPGPTLLRLFRRRSFVVNVQIRRHLMHELPETADGISQWCKDAFVTKDALLERYFTKGAFSDEEPQDIGRPKKSLFVSIFWSSLLACGIFTLLRSCSILASWQSITVTVSFLVLVGIIMQILLQSSEAEHSTPPRKVTDTMTERLIPQGVGDELLNSL